MQRLLTPKARQLRVGEVLDWLVADYKLRGKASPALYSHLKPLRAHFGDWRALDITGEAVDAHIEERREAGKSVATVNRETQVLGQALRLALKRHRLTTIPSIRHLPERNARQGFFERPEFEALVSALPENLRDFTRFAYLTGWRRGEIVSLRWSDVDRDGGAIRLRPEESKNGRGRTVMLEGDLAALMERRWRARLINGKNVRVTDLVFHRDGEPIGDFRRAWTTACVSAGLYHVVKDATGQEKKMLEKLFHLPSTPFSLGNVAD